MNDQIAKGKWQEIKGDLQNAWGKLTHDDLESTKGNISAITGLIQQRYGETKEAVSEKLNSIFEKGTQQAADKTEKAKQDLRDTHVDRDTLN